MMGLRISTYFAVFTLLQAYDVLTTLIFLNMGVQEGNPLIQFIMNLTGTVSGLLVPKIVSLALADYALHRKLVRPMFVGCCIYFAVVAWNLLAIGIQAFNFWVGQW